MGPRCSGKATLLNILATIDTPPSGTVSIGGVDPTGMRDNELALFRRRQLGFVFQDFNLLDSLSLRENILLPLVLDRLPLRQMKQQLNRVAETLGITEILNSKPLEVNAAQP